MAAADRTPAASSGAPRGGRSGPVRVHRGRLQQGDDPLGAGLPQPVRVREGRLACGRWPPKGGVKGDNGIGVDSWLPQFASDLHMPDLPTITEQQHTTRAVAADYVIGRSDTSAFGWGWSQYRIFVRAFDLGKCELFLRGYSGISRLNADVSMVWRDGWRGRRIWPSIGPHRASMDLG